MARSERGSFRQRLRRLEPVASWVEGPILIEEGAEPQSLSTPVKVEGLTVGEGRLLFVVYSTLLGAINADSGPTVEAGMYVNDELVGPVGSEATLNSLSIDAPQETLEDLFEEGAPFWNLAAATTDSAVGSVGQDNVRGQIGLLPLSNPSPYFVVPPGTYSVEVKLSNNGFDAAYIAESRLIAWTVG